MKPKRMANRDFCILFKSQISNCLPEFKVAYVTRCRVATGDPELSPVASESRPRDLEIGGFAFMPVLFGFATRESLSIDRAAVGRPEPQRKGPFVGIEVRTQFVATISNEHLGNRKTVDPQHVSIGQ